MRCAGGTTWPAAAAGQDVDYLLPPPNPSELLGSSGMVTVLEKLMTSFDYVVIDAPPTLPVTDAVVVSKLVDGAIVVVASGMVQRDQLARTLELLGSVNGRVLGLVLNRVPARSVHHYGGYGYEATAEPEVQRPALNRVDIV